MDNSDDYFDSFDLDENDLALLAAEEAKYAESISQVPTRVPDSLPPQKRQKLSHCQLSEDIVDVFLRPDGTYGVAAVSRHDEDGDMPIPQVLFAAVQRPTGHQTRSNMLTDRRSPQSHKGQSPQQTAGRGVEKRPIIDSFRTSSNLTVNRCETVSRERPAEELEHKLTGELATLKAAVEMLKIENDKVKAALQDAETARFAREGEVSILRKRIEKAAQQHAEDLVKLKEAKETASLEQARIQTEMKQQVERLRTEYIFKQHEIESSTHKSAWSLKSKRTALGTQMSPVPVPAAMRNWNTSHAVGSSKSNVFLETPSRRRLAAEQQNLNRLKTGGKPRPATSEMRFPGFENSFLPSSPLNSPSRSHRFIAATGKTSGTGTPKKGKGKDIGSDRGKNDVLSPVRLPGLTFKPPEAVLDELQIDDSIQDFDIDVGLSDGSPRGRSKSLGTESSPLLEQPGLDSIGDLGFSDDIDRDFPVGEGTFEGIDWSEELHYILFTHACSASTGLTFHFLLCVDIINHDYQLACSGILEALGTKYKFASLHKLMEAVAESLMSMAVILEEADKPRHLRALFELLSSIMTYIPSFTTAVIQSGFNGKDITDRLLRMFYEIALKSINAKDPDNQTRKSLVDSMLMLLEAVSWTVSEELQSCLVPLLRSDRFLLTLLDNKQPDSVVSHTIRILVVLATHHSLFQALFSDDVRGQVMNNKPDLLRVPLLERLSSLLVDTGPVSNSQRQDEELSLILNFFFLLLVENAGGRPVLLQSNAFLPCLIHYLTRLSTALWEDDEIIMESPDRAKSTVQNMRQALYLLHRLVLPTTSEDADTSDFEFRQKLFYAPHSKFNGLTHMFIVMIGRLSYADPPDWLDEELQADIEKLTEPARDLMDLVIEGPEGDSVWMAYQDAENESITENDDEMEAQLLDVDGHD